MRKFLEKLFIVYGVFVFRYIFPIVLLPYLSRTLSPQGYGLYLAGLSLAGLMALFIEFCVPVNGQRAVSISTDVAHQEQQLSLYSSVKVVTAIAAIPIYILIVMLNGVIRPHPGYAAIAFFVAVSQAFTLQWFYVGVDRMKQIALIDLSGMFLTLVLMFALVRSASDGWIALSIQGVAFAVADIISLVLILRTYKVSLPAAQALWTALRSGIGGFLARAAGTINGQAAVLMMGFLSTAPQLAFYSSSERLSLVFINALPPIIQLSFPWFARKWQANDRDQIKVIRWTAAAAFLGGLCIAVVLGVFAEQIIRLIFGEKFMESVNVLRVTMLIVPFAALNAVVSWQLYIASNRISLMSKFIFTGGLANIIIGLAVIKTFGAIGGAYSRLGAEILISVLLVAGGISIVRKLNAAPAGKPMAPEELPNANV